MIKQKIKHLAGFIVFLVVFIVGCDNRQNRNLAPDPWGGGDSGIGIPRGSTENFPLACSSFYEGVYLCITFLSPHSVQIETTAFTWTSYPRTMYIAVATVSGCETQRETRVFEINRHDWPRVLFETPPANGSELLDGWHHEIQIYQPESCHVSLDKTIEVAVWFVRSGNVGLQQLVATYRPTIL